MPLTDDGWLTDLDAPRPRCPSAPRRRDPSVIAAFVYPDDQVYQMGWEDVSVHAPPGIRHASRPPIPRPQENRRIFEPSEDVDQMGAWIEPSEIPTPGIARAPRTPGRAEPNQIPDFIQVLDDSAIFQTDGSEDRPARCPPPKRRDHATHNTEQGILAEDWAWAVFEVAPHPRRPRGERSQQPIEPPHAGTYADLSIEIPWGGLEVPRRHRVKPLRSDEPAPLPGYPGVMDDEHPLAWVSWCQRPPRPSPRPGKQTLNDYPPAAINLAADVQPPIVACLTFEVCRRPPQRREWHEHDHLDWWAEDGTVVAGRSGAENIQPPRRVKAPPKRTDTDGVRPHEQASYDVDQAPEITVRAAASDAVPRLRQPHYRQESRDTAIVGAANLTDMIVVSLQVHGEQAAQRLRVLPLSKPPSGHEPYYTDGTATDPATLVVTATQAPRPVRLAHAPQRGEAASVQTSAVFAESLNVFADVPLRRAARRPTGRPESPLVMADVADAYVDRLMVFAETAPRRVVRPLGHPEANRQQVSYNGTLTVSGPYRVVVGTIFVCGAVAGKATTQ